MTVATELWGHSHQKTPFVAMRAAFTVGAFLSWANAQISALRYLHYLWYSLSHDVKQQTGICL